mmetsp:Transcript_152660/g.292347  ORF Transcript_152660/g.292347 Transcript_152660/m.292347 type:complete len:378 (+) Transcript_152660:221-1354(+)
MSYRTLNLNTWEAFAITYTTIWFSRDLWKMMLRLYLLALLVCIFTLLAVAHPGVQKVSKFTDVSKFLNVVVGLLLGFFLSNALGRWHSCVNGFLELLDAARNLQMQLATLGVPEAQRALCMRYSFAAAWLLYGHLLLESNASADGDVQERARMWQIIGQKKSPLERSHHEKLLHESEIAFLKTTRDPPGILFMWIAALIGRLAQDGWIPPMASPTYGRIMTLCQSGHAGIRQVRAAVSVQHPLIYSHMLATLVHINNILNAVTLGIVAGLSIGTTLKAHGLNIHPSLEEHGSEKALKYSEQDLQNLVITFFYSSLGPLLYQALLTISMHLAQPFSSLDSRMPLHRLCHQLELDMVNARDAIDHLPFDKPYFRQPSSV